MELAQFEVFFDFAFPCVQNFAMKRAAQMEAVVEAEALTELIRVSVLTLARRGLAGFSRSVGRALSVVKPPPRRIDSAFQFA